MMLRLYKMYLDVWYGWDEVNIAFNRWKTLMRDPYSFGNVFVFYYLLNGVKDD